MAASSSFLLIIILLTLICLSDEARGELYDSPISELISEDFYKRIFLHTDDTNCPAKGFYGYDSFIAAANFFPEFASSGNLETRKRELAAFLAQISHETAGGWETAPDGPYAWGLCHKEELNPPSNYCDSTSLIWHCYPNKSYHGRGPIQLSWNYNYGVAGKALGYNLLEGPEQVGSIAELSFKTALWFWMTPAGTKPSCHDVMVGRFRPKIADIFANRIAGFGLVTNIINGGIECGIRDDPRAENRIGFYKRYAAMFNVPAGRNLDCQLQKPYYS